MQHSRQHLVEAGAPAEGKRGLAQHLCLALGARARGGEAPVLDRVQHRARQAREPVLQHVVLGAELYGAHRDVLADRARHHDAGQVAAHLAHQFERARRIEPGHVVVEDADVEILAAVQRLEQRLLARHAPDRQVQPGSAQLA